MPKRIVFVTRNENKFREVKEIAEEFGIKLVHEKVELPEIQGEIEEITRQKAKAAFSRVNFPVIVEDTSFEINALNGFPGPYASFVYETIGIEGILKLMKGIKKRDARFVACVAYYDGTDLKLVKHAVDGEIAKEARGKKGWGFDPIFIPKGHKKTFAEDPKLKMKVSHRAGAFRKLFAIIAGVPKKKARAKWVKVGEETVVSEVLDKYEIKRITITYEVYMDEASGEMMRIPVKLE